MPLVVHLHSLSNLVGSGKRQHPVRLCWSQRFNLILFFWTRKRSVRRRRVWQLSNLAAVARKGFTHCGWDGPFTLRGIDFPHSVGLLGTYCFGMRLVFQTRDPKLKDVMHQLKKKAVVCVWSQGLLQNSAQNFVTGQDIIPENILAISWLNFLSCEQTLLHVL